MSLSFNVTIDEMNLLSTYSSDSDREVDLSNDTGTTEHTLKRKKRISRSELRAMKQRRKGKSPWGSWSDNEDNYREEEVNDGLKEPNNSALDTPAEGFNDMLVEGANNESIGNVSLLGNENSNSYLKSSTSSIVVPPLYGKLDLHKPLLSFKCYMPKKIKYTYDGHKDGTNCLEFIPHTGHVFLSGGNDNTIRIWSFYQNKKLLRDYKGHTRAPKSLQFDDNGTSFLSASFDQTVKIWDTETGKVKKRLGFSCTPNAVCYRPLDNGNEFIVGLSNHKIHHYDSRVSEKNGHVQTYDHHLGSILTLRYFPDGTKFISTSEDKTIRIWENQINVPIKQISDTTQHSMPHIDIHPAQSYFCAQSMDNCVYTYGMKPKYKKAVNKIFKRPNSSGYSTDITFSSDGNYICAGDSTSKVSIWDWKTTKLLNEITIPGRKPVTQVQWHPQETSKVICSGVNGKIYVLD